MLINSTPNIPKTNCKIVLTRTLYNKESVFVSGLIQSTKSETKSIVFSWVV